jgi:hypothetical protein
VSLTTAQVSSLTTAQVSSLTTAQAVAIETADVAALKTSQISALSTADVAALTTNQVQAITTASVAALTTSQLVAITTDQVVALTTSQVAALTTAGLAALSTSQIVAIETVDVAALKTSQIAALTTANLVALTTSQIGAFTSSQAGALTTGQVEALTTAQIGAFSVSNGATGALHLGTPIVLDLNGDGVKTQSIGAGVKFDLFATGNQVNTGWVSNSDGLLVLDRNHDGKVNDGSELFGSSTTLADGSKAADGYQALKELDSNGDGVINQGDAAFADLKVWVDANSDGITEGGELKSLADLKITSISANADVNLSKDNGNLIGLTSSYQTADGASHAAADVWFVADKNQTVATTATSTTSADAAIAAIQAQVLASGGAQPSPEAVSIENTSVAPVDTAQGATNLRARVSELAQAMGSFDGSSGTTDAGATLSGAASGAPGSSAASLAVVSMVDVMKQFDSNGNQLTSQVSTTASVGKTLNMSGTSDPAANALLASNGIKPLGG